jgi:quinolinate synthase
VARESGKQILFPQPNEKVNRPNVIIGWRGACEVHERFTVEDIRNIRSQFPGVQVLAHPECPPEVVDASDYSQSTSRMVEFVKSSNAPHFLLLTECSMADNIIAENPSKDVLRLCSIRCPHMNEITLEDTLNALRNNEQNIEVPADVASRARVALERMLAVR